ncbi:MULTISPECIES: phosphotransferase [Pontibacillus]|uniref:Phosphotransferase n=1 Tax=Pontibacillus chungwhensis TaxID=265426 RepID=A0ABY8UTX9_9BACI|nr:MULTISPECIES: phosphotransferase [Pontibacillus]MCD5323747.1 phosphotransferase [Pontibacillus sp. HN14]WIF97112.1 phosphotransferase [Pontibacillus chungwhensis]
MNQEVVDVLSFYGLTAYEMEQYSDKVTKAYTPVGPVAVKRSEMDERTLHHWLETYRQIENYQFQHVMPLYMAANKELYVSYGDHIYYVMPWMDTPNRDTPPYPFEQLYRTIGKMHKRTLHTEVVKREDYEERMNNRKTQLQQYRESLAKWVQTFEEHHYMSPVELQICTHYRDLDKVCEISMDWCDRFLDDLEEDKQVRTALIHGNVKPSHFLYDDSKPYLLNWERSKTYYPAYDITTYFYHVLRYHDAPVDQLISTFSYYEEQLPLLNSERCLLALFLLNPESYIRQIESYVNDSQAIGQPFLVQKFERSYYVLRHALDVQEQIEQARLYQEEQAENG